MYRLNANSYSARFYSWIWDTDVTKIRNMCPYFWTYVFTIILLPLILIIKGISYIVSKVPKPVNKGFNSFIDGVVSTGEKITSFDTFWYYVGKLAKWIVVVFSILMMIFLLALVLLLAIQAPLKLLTAIGAGILTAVILYAIVYIGFEKNVFRTIGSFIKLCFKMVYNLYKNICPMVIWEK